MKLYFHFLTCLALPSVLHAAPLYTGADLSSITSGTISDYQGSPANYSAARFTLTSPSSTIQAISFHGAYFGGGDQPSVTTDLFGIAFFTSGLNGPGAVIDSAQTSLSAARSAAGVSDTQGHTIYYYELDLSATVTLPAGDYWVGISRNNPNAPAGTGANWIWSSDQTQRPAYLSQSGNPFSFSGTDNANPAFTLEDTPFTVPESNPLLLSVLAAAMTATRRKRSISS